MHYTKETESIEPLLDRAVELYRLVAENLESVSKIFPFKGPTTKGEGVKDPERFKEASQHLGKARKAEESGLRALDKISAEL